MANTAQARKRVRQNQNVRNNNRSQLSRARTALKAARAVENAADMPELMSEAFSKLDKLASKKILSRNTAARLKKRLHAHAKRLSQSA